MERSFFQKPQRKDSLLFAGKDSMLAGSCVGKLSRMDAANGAVGAEDTPQAQQKAKLVHLQP